MTAGHIFGRRAALAGAMAGGAATALAACGAGADRTVITLYESKPEAIPYFSERADEFTRSHESIRVVHDATSKLSADFTRGNPPDLGCLNYNLEMARFMERGALSDLGDMPEAGRIRPDVLELVDQYPGYEDRTSVLPYSVMAASVIYNKQIFAEHGLSVPTTWDELIIVCDTLRDAGVTPVYATFKDAWSLAQGPFDYCVGGMVDVAAFFQRLNELGPDLTPTSDVSFSTTLREPVERMVTLLSYTNEDAVSRGYGDGNTAMANAKAAMYLQGPWAFGEIDKAGTEVDLGTFPLPMTDSADDLKVRVNIDLSLWIPEASAHHDAARELIAYLMQPDVQHPYNAEFLGFGTTKDAPAATDPRIVEMQGYYDQARFYQGASKFIPLTIPTENYLQAVATGADVGAILRQLDDDWARLAYRR